MVKQILLICLLFLSGHAMSQDVLALDPNPVHGTGLANETDIEVDITVRNTSSEELQLLWTRNIVDAPSNWLSWVCDLQSCYLPTINSAPANRPNILPPDSSMQLQIHINPGKTDGAGQITVDLYDASDPGTILGTIESSFQTSTSASGDIADVGDIRVYPNPATSYFRIHRDENVARIIVYNYVGKVVRNLSAHQGASYDISTLPVGMYLVRLFSQDKAVLKTIRLSRR